MRIIHDIHGGIHPPENKHQSTAAPIRDAGLPAELVLPLNQHIGAPAEPIVEVGQRVLRGEMIAAPRGPVSVALHAPTSGEIAAIEIRGIPHPSGMQGSCIVLRPDGRDEAAAPQPLVDFLSANAATVVEHIRRSGIAGLGGAGFPTATKLGGHRDRPIETLIINGTECEPYITADDMLMRTDAQAIIGGVEILRRLVAPTRDTVVGIEDNKPEAIAALRAAAEGTGIEIAVFPTKYPSGGEKQLIQILTGKEVPSGGLPADIGIVCQNVGTTAAIYHAVVEGRPLISRITTVTGEACTRPGNFLVRLGTPLRHLLDIAGFDPASGSRLIIGGPMMGYAVDSIDLPVIKTTNCILAPTAQELPAPPLPQACIRCGHCAEACPASLLPQQLYWFARGQEWDKLEQHNLFDCIECGACSYVCPSHIPLVQYYRAAKGEIRHQQQDKAKADRAKLRFEARKERIAREEAEKEARRKARQAAARASAAASKEQTDKQPADTGGAAAASATASATADPVQAAIERAKAKKAAAAAGGSAASPADPARQATPPQPRAKPGGSDAIAGLEKRLLAARNKLETAREQGSDKLAAFEQSVQLLEEKLAAAREQSNAEAAATSDTPPEPEQAGTGADTDTTATASDAAQAAIARAQARRAGQVEQPPQEKAKEAVARLRKRLDHAIQKLEQAESEGLDTVEALRNSVATLTAKLNQAEADLAALGDDVTADAGER